MSLLLLSLLACPVPTDSGSPADPKDTGGDTGGDTDSGKDTAEDSGKDTGDVLPAPEVTAVLGVLPATLPASAGGTMTVYVRVNEDYTAADVGSWAASVDFGGSVAEAAVEVVSAKELAFTFTVPGGLSVEGGRAGYALSVDGTTVATVPVALSIDPDSAAAALGSPNWSAFAGSTAEGSPRWVSDADGDGAFDVLSVTVRDGCVAVVEACPADGGACSRTEEDLCAKVAGDLSIASTNHFRTAEGGDVVAFAAQDDKGQVFTGGPYAWSGGTWSGSGTVTQFAAIFGAVLGLNTSKEDKSVPLAAMLDSGDGISFGQSGSTFTASTLGAVKAAEVGTGNAFAGLFSGNDLSGDPSKAAVWGWVFDVSTASTKGTITGSVLSPDLDAGAFSRVRDLSLTAPDFAIESMTASGEDLDGDGHPELFVEAWGEGRHEGWLVLGATDKSNALPVRTLRTACDGTDDGAPGTCGWAALSTGPIPADTTDTTVYATPVQPRYQKGDGSVGWASHYLSDRFAGGHVRSSARIVSFTWDVADLLAEKATEVEPTSSGFVGQPALRLGQGKGHGICLWGKCHSVRGYRGDQVRAGGDEAGLVGPDDPVVAGDLVWVGPDGGGEQLLLGRAFHPDADRSSLSVGAGPSGTTDELLIGGNIQIGGSSTIGIDGGSTITVTGGSVLLGRLASGEPVGLVTAVEVSEKAGDAPVLWWTDGGTVSPAWTLPAKAASDGATRPVLLQTDLTDDDGALLFWRDGEGQAWIALADVAAALSAAKDGELPLLEGPYAVGSAYVDADGIVGEDECAVGLRRRPKVETPFLSMEEVEKRFPSFDAPPAGVTSACADCLDGMVLTVGSDAGDACPYATVYLPPAATLGDAVKAMSPVYTSSSATCDDLALPAVAVSAVADGPALLVTVTPAGDVSAVLFDDAGPRGSFALPIAARDAYDGGALVSAGDVDGDGLADLLLRGLVSGGGALWLADGLGGFVDSGADPGDLANVDHLLGPGPGREGAVRDAGGAPYAAASRGYFDEADFPDGAWVR